MDRNTRVKLERRVKTVKQGVSTESFAAQIWEIMKNIIFLTLLITLFIGCEKKENDFIPNIYIKNANSRITYFNVHLIDKAWEFSKGKNIKIGVLDFLFGNNKNINFYSESISFLDKESTTISENNTGHGFWMASTIKEIAPKAEVFALTTMSFDENEKTEAMIEAIDWAIENEIKILTYSSARFSRSNRDKIDSAVEKAYKNGIITVFLHTPNVYNFLPSQIEPPIQNIDNKPIVNIFKYDYSVVLGNLIDENGNVDTGSAFLSISSKAPVLAGIIAMMLDTNPNLNIDQIREILIETSYTFENYDTRIERTVNAYEAVKRSKEINRLP